MSDQELLKESIKTKNKRLNAEADSLIKISRTKLHKFKKRNQKVSTVATKAKPYVTDFMGETQKT